MAILVGVINPNVVFKFYSSAIKYLDHKFYKEETFSNGPSLITIRRRLSTFADDIETVFLDIKKMIDEGIKRNSLEMCGNREDSNNLFSHEITFGTQAFLSWVGKYNFPIPDELQHCMYQENPAKNDTKIINTPICQENYLFSKYTKIAIDFCKRKLDRGEQLASKDQVEEHLELILKNSNEKLGVTHNSYLPDRALQKIWKSIPKEIRRKRGITSNTQS